jgi:hypothetical protein
MAATFTLLGFTFAIAAESGYVEVGEVPASCPITIKTNDTFKMRPGWKVTPQQAVALAAAAGHARCNSVLLQALYADAENYDLAIGKPFRHGECSVT